MLLCLMPLFACSISSFAEFPISQYFYVEYFYKSVAFFSSFFGSSLIVLIHMTAAHRYYHFF